MILNVSKVVAIIGVNASNERVFLVPMIFKEFIYKVCPIEIPTIPLSIKTIMENTSENQLIVRTTGQKKIEARTFL